MFKKSLEERSTKRDTMESKNGSKARLMVVEDSDNGTDNAEVSQFDCQVVKFKFTNQHHTEISSHVFCDLAVHLGDVKDKTLPAFMLEILYNHTNNTEELSIETEPTKTEQDAKNAFVINDVILNGISEGCVSKLTVLKLRRVSVGGVANFNCLDNVPNLIVLIMDNCLNLSKKQIKQISMISQLEELWFDNNPEVDDRIVDAMLTGIGPSLLVLSLEGCENVTYKSIESFLVFLMESEIRPKIGVCVANTKINSEDVEKAANKMKRVEIECELQSIDDETIPGWGYRPMQVTVDSGENGTKQLLLQLQSIKGIKLL